MAPHVINILLHYFMFVLLSTCALSNATIALENLLHLAGPMFNNDNLYVLMQYNCVYTNKLINSLIAYNTLLNTCRVIHY